MRKNVAVKRPRTWIVAVDDHIPPLAWGDVQCVALPGGWLRPSILCDDRHVHAVKVHWMDHHAFVHETQPQFLAFSRDDWFCRGKALAVKSEPVCAVV